MPLAPTGTADLDAGKKIVEVVHPKKKKNSRYSGCARKAVFLRNFATVGWRDCRDPDEDSVIK